MISRQTIDYHKQLLQAQIDISRDLSHGHELDEVLNRILHLSRDLLGFENAIIRLLDASKTRLLTAASYGYEESAAAVQIPVGSGVMGRAAANNEPILVADVDLDPDYIQGISGARSELAVPLMVENRTIGVFNVESCRPNAFTEVDIAPLMTLAGLAAAAIENHRLYQNLAHANEANRELNQLNTRILQSVDLGIYTIDNYFRITSWNRQMERSSGVDSTEAIGQNLLELFPLLIQEGFAEALQQVLTAGSPENMRLSHRTLRGDQRIQKRRITPLKDANKVTGVLVVVEDITEFRKLLDQTIQSEKLAEIGRLSASIAHEVNNPLSVIAYAVQLLQREETCSESQREMTSRIETEVERLKSLTGGLLSFSRRDTGPRQLTNLRELFEQVLLLIRYELTRKSIQLREDYSPIPAIWVDANQLKQVFINLLMNAAQALDQEGEISIHLVELKDQIEIRIRDNGPGVPNALTEKIFEPFVTTKKEGEGTGLGLYLCRSIIHEHGGVIQLEQSTQPGACFVIRLPIVSEAAKEKL
jgi:PAS domain S-box-containing protein